MGQSNEFALYFRHFPLKLINFLIEKALRLRKHELYFVVDFLLQSFESIHQSFLDFGDFMRKRLFLLLKFIFVHLKIFNLNIDLMNKFLGLFLENEGSFFHVFDVMVLVFSRDKTFKTLARIFASKTKKAEFFQRMF